MDQWENEIKAFVQPHKVDIIQYHSSKSARTQFWNSNGPYHMSKHEECQRIIIASDTVCYILFFHQNMSDITIHRHSCRTFSKSTIPRSNLGPPNLGDCQKKRRTVASKTLYLIRNTLQLPSMKPIVTKISGLASMLLSVLVGKLEYLSLVLQRHCRQVPRYIPITKLSSPQVLISIYIGYS
jgi:hypothetical protein